MNFVAINVAPHGAANHSNAAAAVRWDLKHIQEKVEASKKHASTLKELSKYDSNFMRSGDSILLAHINTYHF